MHDADYHTVFDEIHFTGAFQHLEPTSEEKAGHAAKHAFVSPTKRSKAEVSHCLCPLGYDKLTDGQIVHSTGSLFLIDDSAENARDAASASPPVKVLLFGDYPWNAVVHKDGDDAPEDLMTYVELEKQGLLEKRAKRRREQMKSGWLPDGVERVKDWNAVIEWVKAFEAKSR